MANMEAALARVVTTTWLHTELVLGVEHGKHGGCISKGGYHYMAPH